MIREMGLKKSRIITTYALVVVAILLTGVWFYRDLGWAASIGIEVREGGISEPNKGLEGAGEANQAGWDEVERKSYGREVIESACVLIEQGKFEAAGQLVENINLPKESSEEDANLLGQLKGIVVQWRKLEAGREEKKEAAYKEQLAEFERVKAGKPAESNDVNQPERDTLEGMQIFAQQWLDGVEPPAIEDDANEAAETKGPSAILAAVIRTNEFADENQKKAIMSDPCVLEAIKNAKKESVELERKGKWLEAYLRYYSLLAALDPNNKEYSEYADRLIEKAELVGAFTDNPCETVGQRFEGVKRRIFERAVDELNFKYISKIDYREMALKGVGRCKALSEVVGTLINKSTRAQEHKSTSEQEQNGEGEPNMSSLGESFKEFKPDADATANLCSGYSAMEKEIGDWPAGGSKDKFLSLFGKVLELNLESARLPEGVLIAEFAEASFASLDPYTVIVWPTNVQDFEKAMTNEFSGIGVEISRRKGQLTIASLLPDTPAYNSGLDAGDVIESVDGLSTKDMPIGCAVKHIMGPAGTKVRLTIKREGETQPREITITRARITVQTLRGWERNEQGSWRNMVDDKNKIGYVRLTSFSGRSAQDMEESLDLLEAAGMRGLILDLRYNSGGYFDSAIAISDMFLDDGIIVRTQSRYGLPSYAAAREKGTHPDYPVVLLINSGTASASEILAGALNDPLHKRATLVGERTHGKGVVQGVTEYPGDGAQLKYTMAYYHLPSGQRVKSKEEAQKENTNDWGIAPNVTVEMRSDELRKMFDIQRDNDVLTRAGHDNAAAPVKKHTLQETVEVDPQLETAILVMKSKLIEKEARNAKSQNPISKS